MSNEKRMAVIYCKVSRSVQDPSAALASQEKAIREFMATRNVEITGVFHDVVPPHRKLAAGLRDAVVAAGEDGYVVMPCPPGGAKNTAKHLWQTYLAINEAGATVLFGTVPEDMDRESVLGMEYGIACGFYATRKSAKKQP